MSSFTTSNFTSLVEKIGNYFPKKLDRDSKDQIDSSFDEDDSSNDRDVESMDSLRFSKK